MTPSDILSIIQPAIDSGTVLLVTYAHKDDGTISTHSVVPYSVEPGRRSKTGEPMFWSFCLDHQRIEQRIPENVIAIEPTQGDFGSAPPWPTES